MKQSGGTHHQYGQYGRGQRCKSGYLLLCRSKNGVVGLTRARHWSRRKTKLRINSLIISAMATEQWLEGVNKTPGMFDKIAPPCIRKSRHVDDISPYPLSCIDSSKIDHRRCIGYRWWNDSRVVIPSTL